MRGNSLIFCLCLCFFIINSECKLNEFYHWKQMHFEGLIENESDVKDDDSITFLSDLDDNFIAYNNIPTSVSHYKDKLIITVPRRALGIPSTLNFVDANLRFGSSPPLRPYPNFRINKLEPNRLPDSNRIVSVYRTRIDECGRLWFVDTGALEYAETIQIQPPSLWIIDLDTNSIVQRFEIPQSIVKVGRGIISLNVDVDSRKCNSAHAYISDFLNQRLYVYSLRKNRMWTVSHNYMKYELEYTKYNVSGFEYQWFDGQFSVALGPQNNEGYRTAYFHPMGSISEFSVSTKILQNEKASEDLNYNEEFKKLGERGKLGQSALHDFHKKSGVLIFSQISQNGVSCWNSATSYNPENHALIDQNAVTLVYPVDLNIDNDGILWVITNRMPRFIYGELNVTEYNFRVFKTKVFDAIRGTTCDLDHKYGDFTFSNK